MSTESLDILRLGRLLRTIQGRIRHLALPKLTPFAVQPMLEIGKERIGGDISDLILAEAAEDLIADAMA